MPKPIDKDVMRLLEKVARYYAKGGYGLNEEVSDSEIIKVGKLTKDPKTEIMFNEMIASFKELKKKK